ncbi:phosphatidylserine decarboxylase [Nematocida ausubeli]|uniref:phosphatidylserine decarboxylase n=1 Tax=Nematocida ausubeli (strain ATCC PRA-371 / ERTm2) TaxID=1913371 RepID=A0A086J0T7_NEMA1|nr:uncharacterized protein NESG_01739 [Nematocida ausubeli]KAI5132869.1 phosphatidylserine decarboxylase [Nematocida ausubeli]KAI5135504.1 phosphatidylserine decarboxylase [Nematocida ausubeli]KAI5148272.1 phosphatidylserine decarboxylase [Nematocida ausubeli]KAI5162303.1 phosphatidylserine decarboxylase [Nematocida ausubeli]KFG25755.1 hypothetical protein NESG_01739 [Nematocida ausubeli]
MTEYLSRMIGPRYNLYTPFYYSNRMKSPRVFMKKAFILVFNVLFITICLNIAYDKLIVGEKTVRYAVVRSFPLRTYSRIQGWMCQIYLPWPINIAVLKVFCSTLGITLQDAERENLSEYSSVNDLFTRKLKASARQIEEGLVSPVDGTVVCCDDARASLRYPIKGVNYRIEDLLGDEDVWSKIGKDSMLKHIVIYLAPHNYHRIHSFTEFVVRDVMHIPSLLFSIGKKSMEYFPGLLAKNERVVFSGEYEYGYCGMVAVGSVGVGSISTTIANIKTNRVSGPFSKTKKEFSGRKLYKKGEEIGHFNLGSTVVMVFEWPKSFPDYKIEGSVQMGQTLMLEPLKDEQFWS